MSLFTPLESPTSIRILDLFPGFGHEPLRGHLRTVELSDALKYETISYVWGDPSKAVPFICNGVQLGITRALATAFRYFRHASQVRTLWADSICINQNNNAEKSIQVQLMREIYSNSSKTLIWLGEEETVGEMQQVQELVGLLRKNVRPRMDEIVARRKSQVSATEENHELHLQYGLPSVFEHSAYRSISRLCRRSWWERAWTFQESRLARDRMFQCQDFTISAIDFLSVVTMLHELRLLSNINLYLDVNFGSITNMLISNKDITGLTSNPTVPQRTVGYITSLYYQLVLRRGIGCTMPSDLIYSLLGVVDDAADLIVPDYSKPFEQVFAELATTAMQRDKTLDMLGQTDTSILDANSTLPSWVPDWRHKQTHKTFSAFRDHKYACTGTTHAVVALHHPTSSRALHVQGIRFDTIKAVFTGDHMGDAAWLRSHYPLEQQETYEPTPEPWNLAYLRTSCADMTFFDAADPYRRWQLEDIARCTPEQWAKRNQNVRFFITDKGYMGITVLNARRGDVVVAALGGEVPLLLRPAGEKWNFVGEAYLHGFMDGEILIEERKKVKPDTAEWSIEEELAWLKTLRVELPFDTATFKII